MTVALLPLVCIAALLLAAGSVAIAQPAPEPPSHPDAKALAAQARELARRERFEERLEERLAALDEELAGTAAHRWRSSRASSAIRARSSRMRRTRPRRSRNRADPARRQPHRAQVDARCSRATASGARGRSARTAARAGIYIFDPIEGRSIVLQRASRTATLHPARPAHADAARRRRRRRRRRVRTPQPRTVEVQPGRVVVRRRTATPAATTTCTWRCPHRRAASRCRAPPPMPPLTLPMLPRGKGETKSLGTREFDGIKAEGTQTTHTIPAGEIGNEKPIVITSERWFSPELHVVVFAKTSDPRVGETIYRLANLKRDEPSAELFKVPADYRTRGEGRRS